MLVRWTPRSFLDLKKDMDNLFDSFLSRDWPSKVDMGDWSPDVDVIEQDNSYIVKADIPGMNKDDIKISVTNNVLTIQGERKEEKEDKKEGQYYYYERSYGSFSRSFTLPNEVDSNKVKACYKDGVLKIEIPKSEKVKPKQIPVTVE